MKNENHCIQSFQISIYSLEKPEKRSFLAKVCLLTPKSSLLYLAYNLPKFTKSSILPVTRHLMYNAVLINQYHQDLLPITHQHLKLGEHNHP